MDIINDKNLRAYLNENLKESYNFATYLNKAMKAVDKGESWIIIPPSKTKDGKRKEYYFTVDNENKMIIF